MQNSKCKMQNYKRGMRCIIAVLSGTVAVLGVALGKNRSRRKTAEYILKTWGGKTF